MNRERELLAGALGVLERWNIDVELRDFDVKLIADIRAELEKPEPVECGQVEVIHGYPFGLRNKIQILSNGRYKLLAEKIDD
jgi:hypothetical protein